MRSDVSIGTALSGGLDSSSVLCAMADVRGNSGDQHRLATDWQKAFILVYMDSVYDEKKFAEQVISKTGVTPMFVELRVIGTEPGNRGETAGTRGQTATVETGAVISVPLFISEGEMIKLDTRTGEYVGRGKT